MRYIRISDVCMMSLNGKYCEMNRHLLKVKSDLPNLCNGFLILSRPAAQAYRPRFHVYVYNQRQKYMYRTYGRTIAKH